MGAKKPPEGEIAHVDFSLVVDLFDFWSSKVVSLE